MLVSQCHAPALGVKRKHLLQKLQYFFLISLNSCEKIHVSLLLGLTHPELKGSIQSYFFFFTQQVYCLLFSNKLISTFGFRQMNNLQDCCKVVFLRYLIAKK